MDDKGRFDGGMKIRREVLGADYVDRGMAAADDFMMVMQDLTTRYCWGDIWSRPGLDRKTRTISLSIKAKEVHEEAEAVQSYRSEQPTTGTSLGDLLKEQIKTPERERG